MSQSRIGSLVESIINVAIGLAISLTANALVFPLFGFRPSFVENVAISAIYTTISIVRSYCVRRWFNARIERLARRIAA